ncbi:MAG: hypothetical protein HY674_16600 [Chloroflexi bacterium]|nr:hypothetical protein [Chloroflexota bacterium]
MKQMNPLHVLEEASAEMAAALVVSAETPVKSADGTEYPLLLPKVHAFFSQGQAVTACLGEVHLSAAGEKQCAKCGQAAHVAAFPMVFCAACGVELMTAELRREQAVEKLFPRDLDYTECEGKPVYVFLEHWDQFRAATIGAEPTVVDAWQAHNFPLPERQHEIIRDPEGVPVAEADRSQWGASGRKRHLSCRQCDQPVNPL